MSITGIQHNPYISQLNPVSASSQTGFSGGDGDGDGGVGKTGGSAPFASALNKALSQSGISASGTGTDQAMQAFMQQLLAALQAQSGQGAQLNGADGDNDGSSSANAVNGMPGGHHHGGIGKMESNLQSLIQQLSSSNSSGSSSTDAALQQSFQNLLNTQGSSTNQTTLASFLQTLSQNLQGAGMIGNNVNTLG